MILIILVFIIVIILVYIYCKNYTLANISEPMVDISPLNSSTVEWSQDSSCNYDMTKAIQIILDKYNIKKTDDNKDWTIYIPCSYNDISNEIQLAAEHTKHNYQRIFVLNNCDEITAKNALWDNLVKTYGRNGAIEMMPSTYLLYDKNDKELFEQEYDPDKIYIMKKNIQRQEGLLITRDKEKILDGYKDDYVVVQELLQNPYTINGRKINMRIYLLVICKDGEIGAYAHRNGFMYYTKEPFEKNSLKDEHNITTGYIDRKVYEESPLTLLDLRKYFDDHDRKLSSAEITLLSQRIRLSTHIFNDIKKLLNKVIVSVKNKICNKKELQNNIMFQIFGVDVALNDELVPQIMEINKGPDLGFKDDRDKDVKLSMIEDMFKVLKVIPDQNNMFESVY